MAALLDGMGLKNGHNTVISEEQMRTTGRMLSLFSQGTVALLSSRSILKRGVKAEMTMILNEANNPFKILPSGKTVLMQMYQSQMPGFMQPEPGRARCVGRSAGASVGHDCRNPRDYRRDAAVV